MESTTNQTRLRILTRVRCSKALLLLSVAMIAPDRPSAKAADTPEPTAQVQMVWELRLPANVTGLATSHFNGKDETQLLACDESGTLHVIGLDGKEQRTVFLGPGINRFSVGDLTGDGMDEIVAMKSWEKFVGAGSVDGTLLWKYSPPNQGVDSVVCQDLNGDGKAETAVGFNGSTGLHLVSPEGQGQWVFGAIGNVWNVAAGRVKGDGKWYVMATDAAGSVTVVDSAGGQVAQFKPGFYLAHVYAADLDGNKTDEILAVGIDYQTQQQAVVCLDQAGTVQWKVPLGPEDHDSRRQCLAAGDVDGDGSAEVVALGTDGAVFLITKTGAVSLKLPVGAALNGVCALPKNDQGQQPFVVGIGEVCRCYTVRK
jgi:hypothetical protein